MDEASQLTKLFSESVVQERDAAFAARVRKSALRYARLRSWAGWAVACAGILALVLVLEEMRRAAVAALAPALAAAAGNGLLVQAPIGLALAAVVFIIVALVFSRR